MRALHAAGELTEIQSRPFASRRPAEELYDLANDPHELVNLANDPGHAARLRQLRGSLHGWMHSSGDLGLIPEPILEELGNQLGNKYLVMQDESRRDLVPQLLTVIDAGDRGDTEQLVEALQHHSPSVRYWAATGLGLQGDRSHRRVLAPLLKDSFGGVRVAAALARCRLKPSSADVALLANEIGSDNYIVGMYAIRALELLGPEVAAAESETIRAAQTGPYEFTRRIAKRFTSKLE